MRIKLTVALALAVLLMPLRAQALENENLLALVAMPLAVAAVSEITNVPTNQLVDVVTVMNAADVPPSQFLEVVRYVPAVIVDDDTTFVDFVRTQQKQGMRGPALVTAIEDRIRASDVPVLKLAVDRPRVIDVGDNFVPKAVRQRLAQVVQQSSSE